MVRCYLGLGSNMLDRVGMIAKAVTCLGAHNDIVLGKVSSMYLTEPWGYEDQDDFVNAVAQVDTYLSPRDLLYEVRSIESKLGRHKRQRWGPREIDIDILLYGDNVVVEDDLRIPHPHICERGFVLAPLVEVAPDLVHPETGRKIAVYLEKITATGEIPWQNLDI